MTIKQHGGVFGRNPKFNTLDTDGNANLGDGVLQVDAASNEVGVNTDPAHELDVRGTGGFAEMQVGGSTTTVKNVIYGDNNGGLILYADKDNVAASSSLRFYVDGSEAARFNTSGNLAFVDGKGIDFSATAGTGTSELFDDYEEGLWTPTLTTDGTDFDSVTYDGVTEGSYTKVGNLVTCAGRIRTDAVTVGSGSGNVAIGGLPFTTATGGEYRTAASLGDVAAWAGDMPISGRVDSGTSRFLLLYRTAVNGATSYVATSDVGTGTNANSVYFSLFYYV